MSKTSGCVLIVAGLAVAAYALQPQPQADPKIAAAQSAPAGGADGGAAALKAAGGATVAADKSADPAVSQASPQAPKPAPEPSKSDKSEKSGPPVPGVVPPIPVPAKRPRTAVAAVDVDEAPQRVPVGDSKTATAPVDRAALTREIQRHLKRVGCYRGEVTGVWSPSVRQAMRAFTERANATLPVDGPDPVLLAMVQSHAADACSATCPQGQDRAASGQCVPSALVASATAKSGGKAAKASTGTANKSPGAETVVGSAPPPAAHRPPEGRMSLAGPPVAAQAKAPRRSARVAGWSRSAHAPRPRRAQRSYYSGLPSWAFPFFGQ